MTAPTDVPDGPARTDAPSDLAITGTAVLPEGVVEDALILLRGDRIAYAGPAADAPAHTAAETLRCTGTILPGLVDIHDHGGGGASFPDCADAQEALVAVREHRAHGTTALVASLVTASAEELRRRVAMLAPLVEAGELAALHLEGPFISPARKGAQNPAHIVGGDAALVAELCAMAPGAIATMTVAPEAEDADAVIAELAAGGAIPSLGHTDCSGTQMEEGIAASRAALASPGARSSLPTATHLFNGMRPIHHRDAGPAFACLDAAARGEMIVELIADGAHVSAETVRYVFDIAEPEHVVLVTDAMAATGMADGRYRLGALDVVVDGGVATLAGDGAIAGGTAHLLDVLRFTVQEAGVDLAVAVAAATAVPARVLGHEAEIGALQVGKRADVLLVDEGLRVESVIRGGELLDV